MKNNWSQRQASRYIKHYKGLGFNKDIALRVYTSRLLGEQKKLVIHGGGNTSVKTKEKDLDGKFTEVLRVKGSGWNLDTKEPEGLPAIGGPNADGRLYIVNVSLKFGFRLGSCGKG